MEFEINKRKLLMSKIRLWVWKRSHKYNAYYSSTREENIENIKKNVFKLFFINSISNNDPTEEFSCLMISNTQIFLNYGDSIDDLISFIDLNLENALIILSKWEGISNQEIKSQLDKEYLEWSAQTQ